MQSITKTVQYSLDQIDTLADILYDMKPSCCVYTFKGEMGSGKTTLIGIPIKTTSEKRFIISIYIA